MSDYLNLDPKYSEEEIAFAEKQLGNSQGGIAGFEFNKRNVTEQLEAIRRETDTPEELIKTLRDDHGPWAPPDWALRGANVIEELLAERVELKAQIAAAMKLLT